MQIPRAERQTVEAKRPIQVLRPEKIEDKAIPRAIINVLSESLDRFAVQRNNRALMEQQIAFDEQFRKFKLEELQKTGLDADGAVKRTKDFSEMLLNRQSDDVPAERTQQFENYVSGSTEHFLNVAATHQVKQLKASKLQTMSEFASNSNKNVGIDPGSYLAVRAELNETIDDQGFDRLTTKKMKIDMGNEVAVNALQAALKVSPEDATAFLSDNRKDFTQDQIESAERAIAQRTLDIIEKSEDDEKAIAIQDEKIRIAWKNEVLAEADHPDTTPERLDELDRENYDRVPVTKDEQKDKDQIRAAIKRARTGESRYNPQTAKDWGSDLAGDITSVSEDKILDAYRMGEISGTEKNFLSGMIDKAENRRLAAAGKREKLDKKTEMNLAIVNNPHEVTDDMIEALAYDMGEPSLVAKLKRERQASIELPTKSVDYDDAQGYLDFYAKNQYFLVADDIDEPTFDECLAETREIVDVSEKLLKLRLDPANANKSSKELLNDVMEPYHKRVIDAELNRMGWIERKYESLKGTERETLTGRAEEMVMDYEAKLPTPLTFEQREELKNYFGEQINPEVYEEMGGLPQDERLVDAAIDLAEEEFGAGGIDPYIEGTDDYTVEFEQLIDDKIEELK